MYPNVRICVYENEYINVEKKLSKYSSAYRYTTSVDMFLDNHQNIKRSKQVSITVFLLIRTKVWERHVTEEYFWIAELTTKLQQKKKKNCLLRDCFSIFYFESQLFSSLLNNLPRQAVAKLNLFFFFLFFYSLTFFFWNSEKQKILRFKKSICKLKTTPAVLQTQLTYS